MGILSKDIQTMQDLFLHQLQDIYYAENQILKALPQMMGKATDRQLKQGFETHLNETKTHVDRLERVFGLLDQKPTKVDCPVINGLIAEANEVSGEIADKQVLDAALIASAQAVEHYEITRYGTLVTWALELGRTEAASILRMTLDEEKKTDRILTRLAEARLNEAAISARGRGEGTLSNKTRVSHDGGSGAPWSWIADNPALLATAAVGVGLYTYLKQQKSDDRRRQYQTPSRGSTLPDYDDTYRRRRGATRGYEHATYPEG